MDVVQSSFMNFMFLLALSYILIILLCTAIVKLWIEIRAMQNSTHQITYLDPLSKKNQEFEKLTDEQKEKLTSKLFDNIM